MRRALQWKDLPAAVQARVRGRAGGGRSGDRRSQGRRAGGALAERVGTRFEKAILAGAIAGVVELEGLPKSGARFVGGGKAHALKMPCDIIGVVRAGALGKGPVTRPGIFLDAKSVGEKVAGLRCGDEKIVKRHQAAFLKRMRGAGAIAGLLVECRRHGDHRWLDAMHIGLSTVGWEDPRWLILGPTSAAVDFGKLVREYV